MHPPPPRFQRYSKRSSGRAGRRAPNTRAGMPALEWTQSRGQLCTRRPVPVKRMSRLAWPVSPTQSGLSEEPPRSALRARKHGEWCLHAFLASPAYRHPGAAWGALLVGGGPDVEERQGWRAVRAAATASCACTQSVPLHAVCTRTHISTLSPQPRESAFPPGLPHGIARRG